MTGGSRFLLFLVLILGVGLAVLTLGEPIGWRDGICIILTLSGILLALRSGEHSIAEKSSIGASDSSWDVGER